MNYSKNKVPGVQVSYMMIWERVHTHYSSRTVHTTVWLRAFCWAATIKLPRLHKFPDLSLTLDLFRDFSLTLAKFPNRNSSKVVTLLTASWLPSTTRRTLQLMSMDSTCRRWRSSFVKNITVDAEQQQRTHFSVDIITHTQF